MFYTGRSDLLSDVKAFDACVVARQNGNAAQRQFAEENVGPKGAIYVRCTR